jgi:hypothetical protein
MAWEHLYELRPGKFSFVGDGAVRLVGPSLSQIARDVAAHARYRSISDVVLGRADASGWKAIRPREGQYSWAVQGRRPRPTGSSAAPETQGIVAVVIGLPLRTTPTLGPAEQRALAPLRPYLAPGARLHVIGGHKFTLERHVPASFNGYDAGFTGGVFVAT